MASATPALQNQPARAQPAIAPQPPELKFQHGGKTYKITSITQRTGLNGKEIKVDLSKLSDREAHIFVAEAIKTMEIIDRLGTKPANLMNSRSLTFNFTQNYQSPSLIESTIGRIFTRLAYKPQDTVLNKVTYKETASADESTFEISPDDYDPASQKRVLAGTRQFSEVLSIAILKQQEAIRQRRNTPPAPIPAQPPRPPVAPQPVSTPDTPDENVRMVAAYLATRYASMHSGLSSPVSAHPPLDPTSFERKEGPTPSSGPVIDDPD